MESTVPRTASVSTSGVKRRSLVRGAAWSMPVAAVVAAAPVAAASPEPALSLQGWVDLSKSCQFFSPDSLTINGTGGNSSSPPNDGRRGLWIFAADPVTQWTISDARITFYYPNFLGTLSWSAVPGNSNWSVPVVSGVDPAIAGYTAYTTYYSGTWSFNDLPGTEDDYFWANGRPNFIATGNFNNCSDTVRVYAQRTVTVNGNVITFRRGPVLL